MLFQKLARPVMPPHGLLLWFVLFWMHFSLQPIDAVNLRDREIYKDNSIRTYYNSAVQRKKCKERTMEENASRAAFIFTGTIRDVQFDSRGHERAEVVVKRVIKGSLILDQLPVLFIEGKYASVRHRVVTVHGIDRPEVCINSLRLYDTLIFFTNLVLLGELHLSSSLVRLSLTNIVLTETAVKDKSHMRLPKNLDKPVSCEWKFCPFDGQCTVNHHTQTVECKCLEICPDAVSSVCGSDNVTYDNECQLRLTSCVQQRRIRVLWNESCESHDLCQKVKCGFGAQCVLSPDKRSASCECPEECTSYGSEEVTDKGLICSEDGKQFESLCHLHKTSCKEMKDIKIGHFGKCDPCWNVQCGLFEVCIVDNLEKSKCVCVSHCSDDELPVCGSNGRTYSSRCEMELDSCLGRKEITLASNGSCVNPCDNVSCKYGAQCYNGTCSCPLACPAVVEPVCATDHNIYQNECDMLKTACLKNTRLAILNFDECVEMSSGSDETCDLVPCAFGGQCKQRGDKGARCVCSFECGALRSLVCGSDGKTYSNECYLKNATCNKRMEIRIQTSGHCEGFEEDLCDGNETLVNPSTMLEYDCSPGKETCPAESYCHIVSSTARCCQGTFGQLCNETKFGCCPDETTVALGPGYAGCSSGCLCHPLGSLSADCDPNTGQCRCKAGVGGSNCERCESNFWGMPKIAEGNDGCIPCGCDIHGSIRDDCEQMTGECVCKPFIFGPTCNVCADGSKVTEAGCSDNGTVTVEASMNHENKITSPKLSPLWTQIPAMNYLYSAVKYSANDAAAPIDYLIPSFSGNSYIQLQKLQHGTRSLLIEIEFRSLAPDGLLLYTGENDDGKDDFISIALKNGYVEFRYDLGSGPTYLITSKQVTLKKLHKVKATRVGKDGLLKLDDGSEASAVSPGSLRTLNIGIPLYLGYVPNLTEQIVRNAGTESGFVGCIQFLRIASSHMNKQYELTKTSDDIEADNEITECDLQSCRTVLCENGGICSHHDYSNYTCTCPIGFTGVLCEFKMADSL